MTTVSVKDILTSKTLNERSDFRNIVERTLNDMGNERFFDEYFNIIREYRNEYLQFNSHLRSPTYFLAQPLLKPLAEYLSKKTGIIRSIPINRNQLDIYVQEYAYNNTIPSLIGDPDRADEIDIDGTTYQYRYFLWVKEDDPNLQEAPMSQEITYQNFNTHSRSLFEGGWSLPQMLTFTIVNILPRIVQAAGLNINIRHRAYRNCIKYKLTNRNDLGRCIKHFINKNGDISIGNMNWTDAIRKPAHELARYTPYSNLDEFFTEPYYILIGLVKCLAQTQQVVRHMIHGRFRRIAERQSKGPQQRFKWMNICSVLSGLPRDDLIEFAFMEKILFPGMMSKRELCAELAKKFSERINTINNLKPKCFNQDSPITLESIDDIPPEFFYAYKHNNKLYCDDIRQLIRHFISERSQGQTPRHPLDRTRLPNDLIELVFAEYKYLGDITNTMDNQEEEEELPPQSMLSSKATTFSHLLLAHAPIQRFIDANESLINGFISELRNEFILRNNEINHINASRDLMDKKNRLLDILTLRINSDPRVDGVSQLAVNITSSYNSIFENI